jgi:hypothetical protein
LKSKLEEIFLDILQSNLPERILEFAENNPLIKDEKQMTMAPLYSPTCDVAVGPFSFREGSINEVYHSLANLDEVKSFIANLQENSLGTGYNEVLLDLNLNPRCFIAIEVEKATAHDIKHLLGSVINCSLMAKIGIVVVFDDYLEYAGRLLQYLAFVKRVKKASKDLFRNVFVISKSCMDMLLGISQ